MLFQSQFAHWGEMLCMIPWHCSHSETAESLKLDTIQGCYKNVAFTELLLKDQRRLGTAVLHISFALNTNFWRELKVWPVKNLGRFWKYCSAFLNIGSVINTLVRIAKHVFQFEFIKEILLHWENSLFSLLFLMHCGNRGVEMSLFLSVFCTSRWNLTECHILLSIWFLAITSLHLLLN